MGHSDVDDMFGLGELELGARNLEMNGLEMGMMGGFQDLRNGWHLPTEAFELKQEIIATNEVTVSRPSPMVRNLRGGIMVSHKLNNQGYEILGMSEMDVGELFSVLVLSSAVILDYGLASGPCPLIF
jgi:hypothetical protein